MRRIEVPLEIAVSSDDGRCGSCGGELRPATTEEIGRWAGKGPYVLVTGIPTLRCEVCGDDYMPGDIVGQVQKLMRAGKGQPMTIVTVDFSANSGGNSAPEM